MINIEISSERENDENTDLIVSAARQGRIRVPYFTPDLKEFGSIGALTQGGTGPLAESMMQISMMRQMI